MLGEYATFAVVDSFLTAQIFHSIASLTRILKANCFRGGASLCVELNCLYYECSVSPKPAPSNCYSGIRLNYH